MKLAWSKKMVRKWFNIKSKTEEFQADDPTSARVEVEHRSSFSAEKAPSTIKNTKTEKLSKNWEQQARQRRMNYENPRIIDVQNYSIFVATWNVAGRSPPSDLNLDEWLHSSAPADIYVLGFQEIVPLNAGNVLGAEDNGPAQKWLSLIRKTLNNRPGTSGTSGYHTPSPIPVPMAELDADFSGSTRQKNSTFFHRRSFQTPSSTWNDPSIPQPGLDRRFSVCDRVFFSHRPSDFDPSFRGSSSSHRPNDDNGLGDSPSTVLYSPGSAANDNGYRIPWNSSQYCLVASKQMVGVFLTIWVKSELREHVKNMKVSCVGRGLMGYLGNKGSISISMLLHQTSFCFVCTHLTSGQKEGDELKRNSDVMEILKKTRFPRVKSSEEEKSPENILQHDRVIWLGDLNYRIALSYRSAKALVEMQNWRALLENDQLRIEQKRGHVFKGWNEGKIYFPPTYKYSRNSDRYSGDDLHPKEKRRTPAWCDRILWFGEGLHQLSYVRGESRFSDHRPVYGIFCAEVESAHNRLKRTTSYSTSRVQAEELLPYSRGYTELSFF
ncbi:type I inositol-1,4,5-trisphosphate 5-phosphatase CVP2 [Arabidopsis lyrata subsp. lyrata]|uniref:Type I inositol-1,4,5-trisphosphate 5-phosphatase CVP2 n=1 Tax=Arabidopsis lyrata subsp. lyrata TaxID=81972 RepID=D7KF45_ARALL|nr:type I inositol-1,4,5-trisphosphate 5-phosphatase CVP2 [Arabidopsis lyrata subsp. lyrata]